MANTETKKRQHSNGDNRGVATRLMNESVQMPGFPQIVVTRHFVYQFLRDCGWCPCERGFGSVDYMTFGRVATVLLLTDDATRDRLMAQVRNGYMRTRCDKPSANCATRTH